MFLQKGDLLMWVRAVPGAIARCLLGHLILEVLIGGLIEIYEYVWLRMDAHG